MVVIYMVHVGTYYLRISFLPALSNSPSYSKGLRETHLNPLGLTQSPETTQGQECSSSQLGDTICIHSEGVTACGLGLHTLPSSQRELGIELA